MPLRSRSMENEEREAAPVSGGVELAYLPTRADMAEALRARSGFPHTGGVFH
ncbi:hypothetical protein ACFYT4_33845 [Streptomyces sp. NPDC004609]|uniref:hypothetical protein n=1 Tax=Streptomyces sp. NPDC004609 TaxID=3364704 RepID=UPI0036C423FC